MNYFARNLKILRKSKGMNQEDLAKALGVRKTTISNYETGYSGPTSAKLRQIADFFSVTIEDLLGEKDPTTIRQSGIEEDGMVNIPVYGRLTDLSVSIPSHSLQLPVSFVGEGEFFALKISGERMNRTMLTEGTVAIVRKQNFFDNGNIVVAVLNNEPAIVSRYYRIGEHISLVCDSNNSMYHPIMIAPGDHSCVLLGKVVKMIQDIQ